MKTAINARIDTLIKEQLQELADQMGLSLSSLVSVILTKTAREKKLEFSFDSPLSKEAIQKSFMEIDAKSITSQSLENIKTSQQKSQDSFISI